MAQEIVNIGISADSGNGDPLRTAFTKANNNFTELYSTYIHTSTQWSTAIADTPILTGTFIDLFTLFTDADKSASGTVARDEYSVANGAIIIPYIGKPYEGQRLHHTIRVNFDFLVGNAQTVELQLRRKIDNSVIGASKGVSRDVDFGGIFEEFITYTNSSADAFAMDGFFLAIENNSGATITLTNSIGVMVQTTYEKPTLFL